MTEENVRVIVRVRPLSQKELNEKAENMLTVDRSLAKITIHDPKNAARTHDYSFDAVYDPKSQQTEVFDESVKVLIDDVMQGYNATVFAYGQTGSGKTHTMMGNQDGIIPQSIVKMFDFISDSNDNQKNTQFMVYSSFYEIYQENIRDLMTNAQSLKVRESPVKGVYIDSLSQHNVSTTGQIYDLMVKGNSHRTTAATKMNDTSSRSHSVFVVTVERADTDAAGACHIRRGRLNLVDLAGSERVDRTGAEGERLKEGIKINLSLTMLGKVISCLVKGEKHIPYRDSKLTFLLSDSLGGNSKTLMVAAVSPASSNYEETKATLIYAFNAKRIVNRAKINEDPKDAQIRQMQDTIAALEAQLMALGGGGDDGEQEGDEGAAGEQGEQAILQKIKRRRNEQKHATTEQAAAIQRDIQQLQENLEATRKKKEAYQARREALMGEINAAKEQLVDNAQLQSQLDVHERRLRAQRQQLAEQQEAKRRLKQQLHRDEEEKLRQREELDILYAKIGGDEKKIERLKAQLQQKQQESEDFAQASQREIAQERELLECAQFESRRMRAVLAEFIPADFLDNIINGSEFDYYSCQWRLGRCIGVKAAGIRANGSKPSIADFL